MRGEIVEPDQASATIVPKGGAAMFTISGIEKLGRQIVFLCTRPQTSAEDDCGAATIARGAPPDREDVAIRTPRRRRTMIRRVEWDGRSLIEGRWRAEGKDLAEIRFIGRRALRPIVGSLRDVALPVV